MKLKKFQLFWQIYFCCYPELFLIKFIFNKRCKINLKKLFSENWNFLAGSSQQEADDCGHEDLENDSLDFCQKKSSVGASILSVSLNCT